MDNDAKQAGAFVKYKISRICESAGDSTVRATLARLRRGIGKAPGSVPEIWDVTMNGLPDVLRGSTSDPSPGEWAVHTALTMFALHQQGKDPKRQCMSSEGESLGLSVRNLVENEEDEKRVTRRLAVVTTADSLEELSHHLRGIVQILKSKDLPLDYPELTEDLYRFQFPAVRDSVRLRWGRDFHRARKVQQAEA